LLRLKRDIGKVAHGCWVITTASKPMLLARSLVRLGSLLDSWLL